MVSRYSSSLKPLLLAELHILIFPDISSTCTFSDSKQNSLIFIRPWRILFFPNHFLTYGNPVKIDNCFCLHTVNVWSDFVVIKFSFNPALLYQLLINKWQNFTNVHFMSFGISIIGCWSSCGQWLRRNLYSDECHISWIQVLRRIQWAGRQNGNKMGKSKWYFHKSDIICLHVFFDILKL